MPIYAYKCQSCGFAKDALQKISDPPLTQCPACSAETFTKQLTAAGFQLKGSGWYATDFKGGPKAAPQADGDKTDKGDKSDKSDKSEKSEKSDKGSDKSSGKSDGGADSGKGGKTESGTPAKSAPATKSTTPPATGSGN